MPTAIPARPAHIRRAAAIALLLSVPAVSGCGPSFKIDPVTVRLERADQMLCSAHRYSVWINKQEVGLIRNGATNTFHFTPKIDQKNSIYIEAYDPISKNPVSNTIYFNIGSGGEMTGTVKWEKNGSGLGAAYDLVLDVIIVDEGKYPPASKK